MQPNVVLADGLQHRERTDDVGLQERLRVRERVVDVALGGEVHHGIGIGDQVGHQGGVGDVADHQPHGVGDGGQRIAAARIGQRIEHRHLHRGSFAHRGVHEVCADEASPARDQ